jgi:hypothetical protein
MRATSKAKAKPSRDIALDSPDILRMSRTDLLRGHPFRLRLVGSVMEPALFNGDWLTVEAVSAAELRAGDIILLCTSSQTALVHRLVRLERREGVMYVVTRAEASSKLDVSVPASNVVGRVSHVERDGLRLDLMTFWRRARARWVSVLTRWRFHNVKSA